MEESEEEPSTLKGKIPSRKTSIIIPRIKKQKTKNIKFREIKDNKYTYKILAKQKLILA